MCTDVLEEGITFICLVTCYALVSCSADFDPEEGGETFLLNVGAHIDYTVLYPRRWQHSSPPL
jgi:hypothetical protein